MNEKTEQSGPDNPRPSATSGIPPANSASRAGDSPEASGDSSSGTFAEKAMTTWVRKILTSLGSLLLAFVLLIATLWFLFAPEKWEKRKAQFETVASKGMVVVEAIQRYTVDHGAPPPDLQALVPQYLSLVPQTGLRDYPAFEYEVSANSNAPWELRVECSSGFLNWDVFFYWPTEDYPKQIYGGGTELIGKWAYVHE